MGFQAWIYEGVDSLGQQGAILRKTGFVAWGLCHRKEGSQELTVRGFVAGQGTWNCYHINRPAGRPEDAVLRELPIEVWRCTNKGQSLASELGPKP